MAINKKKINLHSSNLFDCQDIDFLIKPDEKVKAFMVEFILDEIGKSYYMERRNVEFWRSNAEWSKANRIKLCDHSIVKIELKNNNKKMLVGR